MVAPSFIHGKPYLGGGGLGGVPLFMAGFSCFPEAGLAGKTWLAATPMSKELFGGKSSTFTTNDELTPKKINMSPEKGPS